MNKKAFSIRILIGLLVLGLAVPPGTFAQSPGAGPVYRQEDLDQMLAPIALYPDSLLAQVLVAATYPDQVFEADAWVQQNSSLQGDQLNDAVDQMTWDLSVKALVPFPKVLDMMTDKREWTQKLGDAFLVQQADVMDCVQRLRSKAYAAGNLKTTTQQVVEVKGESIEIQSASPEVVYVPAYNPTVVYGTWWYPAYPPFAYSPWYPAYVYDPYYVVPGIVAVGALGFIAGVAVGSYWHSGWGHWNWGHRDVVVNVNRTVNINSRHYHGGSYRTSSWNHVSATRRTSMSRTGAAGGHGRAGVGGTRPTAASVQKGLKTREGGAQVRGSRGAGGRGSQEGVRSSRGQAGKAGGRGESVGAASRGSHGAKSSMSSGSRGAATRGGGKAVRSSGRSTAGGGKAMSGSRGASPRGGRAAMGAPRGGGGHGGGAPRGGGGAPRGGGGHGGGGHAGAVHKGK